MVQIDALKDVYVFGRLPEETLAAIAAVLQVRHYAANEILFHKGDPGQEMVIVKEGSVAIFEPSEQDPGRERPLRIFRAGQILGEMALIDLKPRTLSARAVQPTEAWILQGSDFRRLLQDHQVALAVMSGLNDRIRYTTDFLGEVRQWVGRMARGQYETAQFFNDMQEWVRQLAEGDYAEPDRLDDSYQDPLMATLAAEFARMATQVRQREEELRQEIAQLKIEIDQTKKERQVEEITESDFFQDIQARARHLRSRRGD
jgi:CRP-like cAMP-binding protein